MLTLNGLRGGKPNAQSSTTSCPIDVRSSSTYRACIRAASPFPGETPEGQDHWMQGVYREIVEPERLVFTFAWEDEDGQPKHETLVTVTFAEQDSKTRLTFHQAIFESIESRDSHRSGWSECSDHLEAYLMNTMAAETQ
jgi:uncharacterized protein YndB with AHSA1/START domain